MCDQCTGESSSYIQESTKVNVLQNHALGGGVGENSVYSGACSASDPDFIETIWSIVAYSFDLMSRQIREETELRSTGFFTNAFDSAKAEQGPNVASCLSKVDGVSQMNNHLILYLVTRMLKVFNAMSDHGVPLSVAAVDAFKKIEASRDVFGDAFALLKDRIDQVELQVQMHEL